MECFRLAYKETRVINITYSTSPLDGLSVGLAEDDRELTLLEDSCLLHVQETGGSGPQCDLPQNQHLLNQPP